MITLLFHRHFHVFFFTVVLSFNIFTNTSLGTQYAGSGSMEFIRKSLQSNTLPQPLSSTYSQTPALEPNTQEVGAWNSSENHCKATPYPNLCYNSLSIYASSIQTNPWLLADTALPVALSATQNTSSFIRKLSRSPQIRPRDVGPMEDCLNALGDAVQDLKDSIVKMAHIKDDKNFLFLMSNIQTRFSAAFANEDSCTDAFSENAIVSKVKMAVTRKIKSIVQLTSNALTLINNYASDHVQGRRVL